MILYVNHIYLSYLLSCYFAMKRECYVEMNLLVLNNYDTLVITGIYQSSNHFNWLRY